jgi:hypothetical protein
MPGPFSFWPLAIAALSVAACASVAAPTEPSPDSTPDATTATPAGEGGAAPAPAPTDAPADSAAPAASAAPTASAAPSASASAAPAASVAALLEMSEPKFTSGEVPKAQAALEKLSKKLKTCIDEGGGLQTVPGSLEIQFLVRAAGVAEGVDIVKSKGVSDAAKKCIVSALQKKTIGTPSSDPVGVTVTFKLTAAK